ncbi:MAG TPA: type VI secretion system baseplate subunit TssF, partial [Polyangiaceae bacterium]|nr:type VI secretion system baseplate subunit TssF [Polyangiaceae bacterium]
SAPMAAVVRQAGANWRELIRVDPVRAPGFEDDEALLPCGARSFQGYRLLQEYFAAPKRFLFAELTGLANGVRRADGTELDIALLLDRHDPELENTLSTENLRLFCAPAVNLFPHKADRIHLSDNTFEFHVVPDRTRPTDLEVHSVTNVEGFGSGVEERREFSPLYARSERMVADEKGAFYTVHRRATLAHSRQRRAGARSAYVGSETFLSLVDGEEGPFRSQLRQLAVDTLCTNRDLSLYMPRGGPRTDFHLESGAPVNSVRCLLDPTAPRPSHAWGRTSWRLVSHLSLNYLSLVNAGDGSGAAGLRGLLHLYAHLADIAQRRQIDGVQSVESTPITRRIPIPGPASFGRGLEIRVSCDETAFEGTSAFLLGAVLERFFAKYVSINSFTSTVLRSAQRGEIMRWPARIGGRSIG